MINLLTYPKFNSNNHFAVKSTAVTVNSLCRMSKHLSSANSPTFPSLHLRHSSFSNPSFTLPMSQLILQTFRCITYVTAHSPNLPLLHLCHSSFSKPSFTSRTSQALHLRHLASCPWAYH